MAKKDIEKAMKEADRLAAQPMRSDEDIAEEFQKVMREASEAAKPSSRRKTKSKSKKK
ncbi:MAG: hypothetical protein AABY01_00530 [Nanoarchaeota archaeon]